MKIKKDSLLTLFSLVKPSSIMNDHHDDLKLKKAAVLMLLVKRKHGINVIFTVRALHLRHHPGQVSFPGGKFEEKDKTLKQTAQRETIEEIGIHEADIDIFGELPTLNTVSGFRVYPFIGFVNSGFSLYIDKQEVQEVFEVPLTHLLKSQHYFYHSRSINKKQSFTYCIPYKNHLIWGATAQICKHLQTHLNLY